LKYFPGNLKNIFYFHQLRIRQAMKDNFIKGIEKVEVLLK